MANSLFFSRHTSADFPRPSNLLLVLVTVKLDSLIWISIFYLLNWLKPNQYFILIKSSLSLLNIYLKVDSSVALQVVVWGMSIDQLSLYNFHLYVAMVSSNTKIQDWSAFVDGFFLSFFYSFPFIQIAEFINFRLQLSMVWIAKSDICAFADIFLAGNRKFRSSCIGGALSRVEIRPVSGNILRRCNPLLKEPGLNIFNITGESY